MGASSGWNLVARRPPRARVAQVSPTRHLVKVPLSQGGEGAAGRAERSDVHEHVPEKRDVN
jgi:hypothetical protein